MTHSLAGAALWLLAGAAEPGPAAVRGAVTFYASFEEAVRADVAGGARTPDSRSGPPGQPDKHVFTKGFDAKVFRVARDRGVHGGALEATDVLPLNGRIFF